MGDFEWLFREEYSGIVRLAYVMLGDRGAAEDTAQEAFARLYAHWRRVSRYEKPGSWVRRVAINVALTTRARKHAAPPPPVEPAGADPDLHRAILALPGMQRAAITLHYFEDRPVAEVASILGCSQSTAKVHLHRARKRLAEVLGEEAADVPG